MEFSVLCRDRDERMMMAVGAVGNRGVGGFQAPVDARCVHGSGGVHGRGAPEGWHRLVYPISLGRRRRSRLRRQWGGGFRSRGPQAGGAAPWWTSVRAEPVGTERCVRSRTRMHGAGAGAAASTEPAGVSRYVKVKPRHPNSHGHGTGTEDSGLDHGPRTCAEYCQPYCQPFLSPRVPFSPRQSPVGPRFPQQNQGLLRFLDNRERVRSQTLYPAELRARETSIIATARP